MRTTGYSKYYFMIILTEKQKKKEYKNTMKGGRQKTTSHICIKNVQAKTLVFKGWAKGKTKGFIKPLALGFKVVTTF